MYRTSIFHRDVKGTCPHDPLTTAEALYPGIYFDAILHLQFVFETYPNIQIFRAVRRVRARLFNGS